MSPRPQAAAPGRRMRWPLYLAAAPVGLVAVLLLLDALFPFPWARLARPTAVVVEDRSGDPLRIFLPPDGILRLPRAGAPPPRLARAVIASEDRWLGVHPGVNPLAVARAALANLRAGHIVSGASTLPMQVARLAEPRPRTWYAKGVEALRALQLSWHRSAEEVLAAWLDLAPFGGNVEGVDAAAWAWFGKRPEELSVGEIALLTALPRAPVAYDPERHPDAARAARDRVLDRLAVAGVFPADELAAARRQPLPTRRRAAPLRAPHLAELVRSRARGETRIRTTIDAATQELADGLVRRRVAELRAEGIGNAAAVVLERRDRALRALVGSADFLDRERPGQVNGALARRSPGSTLKPFLYALAFEEGELVPASLLLDVPTDFAGYVPENNDGRYRGQVTARAALQQSLNAPAVRLLAQVGVAHFLERLRAGGLLTLDRPAEDYGLPLVLGGGEVRLLDLTNLYATLADDGWYRGVQLTPGPVARGERWVSAGAARLVTQVLTGVRRPDLPASWDLTRDAPAVAWKTGTSYGHRDAWAVGFSQRYAVGVWVGNLDGHGRSGLSGASHAAPLLFDLLRALEPRGAVPARGPRPDVVRIEVCAESRELAGPFCPARLEVDALRGVTHLRPCSLHRRAFVDARTGERLVGDCLGKAPHRAVVLRVFPAELVAWWRGSGQPVPALPPLRAGCGIVPASEAPRIVSPEPSTPYRLRAAAPADFQKLRLLARAGAGVARLHWYQDGRFLGARPPAQPLFVPLTRGAHRVVVVDDAGRMDAVAYAVE